jgi:exonuclease III
MTEEERRQKLKEWKVKQRVKQHENSARRIHTFQRSIKYGRIFECICCHRRLFENSVTAIQDVTLFQNNLNKRCPRLFEMAIHQIETRKSPNEKDGSYHICFSCNGHLNRGHMPPMSHKNNLQLFKTMNYPELNLTEVENSLIALNLIFQKLYQLPKSRWPAMKDKTINIPIYEADVLQTVEALPRTPSAAQIVPVKLKRKLQYKNVHKIEYISVEKVLKALQTLKRLGNKYYEFVPEEQDFREKCKNCDVEGFQMLYPEEEEDEDSEKEGEAGNTQKCQTQTGNDGDFPSVSNNPVLEPTNSTTKEEEENNEMKLTSCCYVTNETDQTGQKQEMEQEQKEKTENRVGKDDEPICHEKKDGTGIDDESDKEEEEYVTKDPVRKWQFQYNLSTCFSNNYPEISYKDDIANAVEVAPGEGKTPTNVLQTTDWDLKSFPCLHPDGKNGIHEPRQKLTDQNYFVQRIMNKDRRFANNPGYVFAATAFVEKKQMERNIGVSFLRGKANKSDDGTSYSLDDPCSVLDNVKNTPRYWQKAKFELIARLENIGPFTFFFTLSCGDMRWPENFTSLLDGHDITYEVDTSGREKCRVDDVPLADFLRQHQSKHEFIRKNLLNATLTFHHRVKMFVKHIIMSKGNDVMPIKYNSYKTEFQFRGAAHIHGVLWMDWEKCTAFPLECVVDENGQSVRVDHIANIKSALTDIKNDTYNDETEKKFASLELFADKVITCSLTDETADIVKEVNVHHHTRACRKYGTQCRFHFPKLPSLRTIISVPERLLFKEIEATKRLEEMNKLQTIVNKVKSVLVDDDAMEKICSVQSEELEEYKKGNRTEEQLMLIKEERLEKLLEKAGIETDCNGKRIPNYEKAIKVSQSGFSVIHKRDVAEIFVNNYNKEWISAFDANMDLQICLDYFAIITYISDYYGKDDSGTLKFIKDALKEINSDNLKEKLQLVVNKFLTHRQIGESEAYYRILPSLHLNSANTDCKFVPTGFKQNRSTFLKRCDESEKQGDEETIHISGKEGEYTEKPSLINKYSRRDCHNNVDLKNLCYAQFVQRYVPSHTGPKQKEDTAVKKDVVVKRRNDEMLLDESDREDNQHQEPQSSQSDELITHMSCQPGVKKLMLPKFIRLTNPLLGEPPFMKLRSPYVLRFHKLNKNKNPHEYMYSELQLYRPFVEEDALQPNNFEQCEALFEEKSEHNGLRKLHNVKSLLMPHLDSVEEASKRAQEAIESNVGDTLDATNEQDNVDCEEEGLAEHPDHLLKNPEPFLNEDESTNMDTIYKRIELCDDERIKELTFRLDEIQRKVLEIGVSFAKNLKKTCQTREVPLITIQGGAGSGKSTLIEVLCQRIEQILRKPGDNPNHPYIIKAAFTGTAAANIEGQTLTSAFSFPFGNEFYSLGDKARDQRRMLLENLAFVVIDEFSMIKADMLYQLDLRLKEVKQKPDLPFGGVAIFFFGDILQLQPVKGKYIFEQPTCESYHVPFLVDQKVAIIHLVKNHRQEEDKLYADVLNRIRSGEQTPEDMTLLRTRVRPEGHPELPQDALVVTPLNREVNRINEERLSEVKAEEHVIEARCSSRTKGSVKPYVDQSGAIRNTQLQNNLKLKIGARVVLTVNINTADSLTNGSFGQVVDFQKDASGEICAVLVSFNDDKSGKDLRRKHPHLQGMYGKPVTPVKKIEQEFTLSGAHTSASSKAKACQFPLKLAYAATAFKVQGLTVPKPNSLIIDLRPRVHAAEAYVMLSRVQELSQLFILGDLPDSKIFPSELAMRELNRMRNVALNNTLNNKALLSCINVYSLNAHFKDLTTCASICNSDVICVQETWLPPDASSDEYKIDGFQHHFTNAGRGKGICIYFSAVFTFSLDLNCEKYQLSKITSDKLDIINVYRSSNAPPKFIVDLTSFITPGKLTYITGDFNICYLTEKSHQVVQTLHEMGFSQLVQHPTHSAGRLLDHFYTNGTEKDLALQQEAPYYSDHDVLFVRKFDSR